MKKLFVDKDAMSANQRFGSGHPVIAIQFEDGHIDTFERVNILGPSAFIYDSNSPIRYKEGSITAWIETESPIEALSSSG